MGTAVEFGYKPVRGTWVPPRRDWETRFRPGGETGTVKQIVTIVRPHLAEPLIAALRRAPLEGLSVTEVKGFGRQKSYLDEYRDTEYSAAFVPKVEITLWVDDSRYEEILDKIIRVTRTGRIGDGKVFVLPVTSFE